MGQITLTVTLDEQSYQVLTQRAATERRDVSALLADIVARELAEPAEAAGDEVLAMRAEWECICALPIEERRALARGAVGSWQLHTV